MTTPSWDGSELSLLASQVADEVSRLLAPEQPSELDVLASAIAARLAGPATVSVSDVVGAALVRGGPGQDTRRAPVTVTLASVDVDAVADEVRRRVAAVETGGSPGSDAARLLASAIASRLTVPLLVATPGELADFGAQVGAALGADLDDRAGTLPREDVDVADLLGTSDAPG